MSSNYLIISLTAETTVYVGQDSHPTQEMCPLVKCDVYILFTDFDHLNTSFL